MCSGFLPHDDHSLTLQIKSAFKSFVKRVKSFISGKSENVIVAKSNDNELAIENPVGNVKFSV